jgi:hypothetical protein
MSLKDDAPELLTMVISLSTFKSNDKFGQRSYNTSSTIYGYYIAETSEDEFKRTGSKSIILLDPENAISKSDKITFNGISPPIKDIKIVNDGDGVPYLLKVLL